MKLLDWGRGAYARAPGWVRGGVGPLVALVPDRLKMGRTYWAVREDVRRGRDDAAFVEQFRARRLTAILRSLGASPFYRRRVAEAFGDPARIASLAPEDLPRFPVLGKQDIRANPEDLLVVPRASLDLGTTSGSGGQPFAFYLDKDRSAWEFAFKSEIWSRGGFEIGQRMAVLRGVAMHDADRQPWEYDAALRELRLSPFHLVPETMDRYLELIAHHRIAFLTGYPSALEILARHAERRRWSAPACFRGVLPISETLFPHQREALRRAFGAGIAVLPFYGLSEKVAIAGEIEPEVYEFEPLYGVTELVDDDGTPVTESGSRGRIVSTGLFMRGMPLIRYDTGDTGVLVRAAERANAYRLRVEHVRSRWGQEFLVAANGARLSIAAINVHSPAYVAMEAFQFYQDTPGVAVLKAVPAPGCGPEQIRPFVDEVQRKCGTTLRIELEVVPSLPPAARGKRPFIDQRIPGGTS